MLAQIRRLVGRITLTQEIVVAAFLLIFILIGVSIYYSHARIASLTSQVTELDQKLARLETNVQDATTSLNDTFTKETQNIQQQLGGVQDQVGVIGGAVTVLKKLSDTDPQLLAKYSKVFFLNENYAPSRLVGISDTYKYTSSKNLQLIPQVKNYLEKMLADAKASGVNIYVESAYRSYNTQEKLKERYTFTYGAGSANQFSADQGYSEHQLGTTVDLITTGTGGKLDGFDKTPAFTWLEQNAYKYGFILSYPKGNGYYVFEPWHWRFVGVGLATDLHNMNTAFYAMDQRTIDTYLPSLFD